jgi:hypothetical protein
MAPPGKNEGAALAMSPLPVTLTPRDCNVAMSWAIISGVMLRPPIDALMVLLLLLLLCWGLCRLCL